MQESSGVKAVVCKSRFVSNYRNLTEDSVGQSNWLLFFHAGFNFLNVFFGFPLIVHVVMFYVCFLFFRFFVMLFMF